jgi:hypothetical protein
MSKRDHEGMHVKSCILGAHSRVEHNDAHLISVLVSRDLCSDAVHSAVECSTHDARAGGSWPGNLAHARCMTIKAGPA